MAYIQPTKLKCGMPLNYTTILIITDNQRLDNGPWVEAQLELELRDVTVPCVDITTM